MTTPDYDADFYTWTQAQAAAIRAQDWAAVDIVHVAEEVEDLWKSDAHHLTMLVLGVLELIARPCPAEEGRYDWQSAVIDQRAHPCKKLRFEYIGQGELRKINGLCPPEHQRFRCVLSDFCYCILLKKHGFKSKPYISVRMRPLVLSG